MRLIQFYNNKGQRKAGIIESDRINVLIAVSSVYELFLYADQNEVTVAEAASQLRSAEYEDYDLLTEQNKIIVPLDHPDPYHMWVTGTGLTHLGSALSRNKMHEAMQSGEQVTDSMKMFKMGQENGKMTTDTAASQPEWFYKGNGLMTVSPGHALVVPKFAMDGGEEPEIAGLYIIDKKGFPVRIGFSLGNEFSDHIMERINYLYLAHSKLRRCSYGPELLLGELPENIAGESKIIRDGQTIWQKEFLTGEVNMSHNIRNLEYHHFKYDMFRQPGDVHVHFFGTSVLSFLDNVKTQHGDIFEISAPPFGKPLRNSLSLE